MPSPFPGMDPYLEGSLWTTLHAALANEIVRQLAPRLRPRYVALPVERMVLDMADDVVVTTSDIYPDVGLVAAAAPTESMFGAMASGAMVSVPVLLATTMPTPVPTVSVEIRDTAQRRLVTAIEILSPANKRGQGREEYLLRRQRILLSTSHLLELDLLRKGQRAPMQQPLPPALYYVLLSRAERRPLTEVWSLTLDHVLPTVPVPLLAGDADSTLDLQQAFDTVYDLLGYDLLIDYAQPPEVALPEEAMLTVAARLRAAGLRP